MRDTESRGRLDRNIIGGEERLLHPMAKLRSAPLYICMHYVQHLSRDVLARSGVS